MYICIYTYTYIYTHTQYCLLEILKWSFLIQVDFVFYICMYYITYKIYLYIKLHINEKDPLYYILQFGLIEFMPCCSNLTTLNSLEKEVKVIM